MSRHASPTAQLLRNSRLFSLPQALPRPIVEQHIRDGNFRSSDSATTPYPLRQAIITPRSAASRGDWGLKRSLPKRAANKASEPAHSVIANDTYESITDYNPASPHVRTLEKFQELGVGMTRQDQKFTIRDSNMSAMEPAFDFTDKLTTPPPTSLGKSRRWKYDAAHVRTMTPSEFDDYVLEKVRTKKEEFLLQLRARGHRQALEEKREAEGALLQSQDSAVDSTAYAARAMYASWLSKMDPDMLVRYLTERETRKSVSEKASTANSQEGEPLSEATIAKEQRRMKREAKGLAGNAAFTFAAVVRTLLKEAWWTPELGEDSSLHGELLRRKVAHTKQPKEGLPRPSYPSLEGAHAATWLKFLDLAEKYEKEFLRAWHTNEWDEDGALFHSYLQHLRKDITLGSQLNRYVREFLDMPPVQLTGNRSNNDQRNADKRSNAAFSAEESTFHLTTHPTAGLSYLRTNNILHNHPILGPQRSAPPVKARVIAPMSTDKMLYGLAGFIGEADTGKLEMDFTTPGGAKAMRKINKVSVNGEGKVIIDNKSYTDREGLAIREGALEPSMMDQIAVQRRQGLADALSERSRSVASITAPSSAPRVQPLKNESVDLLKQLRVKIDRDRGFKPAAS